MKTSTVKAILLCTLVLALALPAAAQTQTSGQRGNVQALSLEEGLLGKDVRTQRGEEVGEIEDVIFSRQGRISHFLLSINEGFLGIGGKTVAVRPDRIRFGAQEYAVFNGTENDLENMPEVDLWAFRPSYRGYYGPGWGSYGAPYGRPYYGPGRGYGPGYGPGAYPPVEGQFQDRNYQQDQGFQQQPQRREYYQDSRQGRAEMRQSQRGQKGQMQTGMSRGMSGDFFLGAPVYNHWNDNLGSVEDLVVDPSSSRITHAVIGVGGVLGIGEQEVVIPFNQLRHVGPYTVLYRGTQEQLEQMPEYQVSENGRVSVADLGRRQNTRAGSQGGTQPQNQTRQGGYQQQ
jgi:sporulation protein YlmC with PRC-barrel domain